VRVLRLLVLSALCGWCWSTAKGAVLDHSSILAHSSLLSSSMPEMPEMVELKTEKGGTENGQTLREVRGGVLIVLGAMGMVGLLSLVLAAQWKQRRADRIGEAYVDDDPYAGHWPGGAGNDEGRRTNDELLSAREWTVGPLESLAEALPVSSSHGLPVSLSGSADDPLATPVPATAEAMPMPSAEVLKILRALASEAQLVRSLVRCAPLSLHEEDYGDALDSAERKLGQMRVTLHELAARFDDAQSTLLRSREANREQQTAQEARG
jgi:hypothetical protein